MGGTAGSSGGVAGSGGSPGGSSHGGTLTGGTGGQGGSGNSLVIISGGSGGTGGLPTSCSGQYSTATLEPTNLLFLIDRSGSMNCNAPPVQTTENCRISLQKFDSNQPSKWEITRQAVSEALQAVVGTSRLNVAAALYPTGNTETTCDFPREPQVRFAPLDTGQATNIRNLLDATVPLGATPIFFSLASTYNYIQNNFSMLGGATWVILLTDGSESCSTEAQVVDLLNAMVPAARDALQISTVAVGLPGSEEGRALLSEIAWKGGSAVDACTHSAVWPPTDPTQGDCHYDLSGAADFSTALHAALPAIIQPALDCKVAVPPGVADLNLVNVQLNGRLIPKDSGRVCEVEAWHYTPDRSKIVLCGPACSEARAPQSRIDIMVGCPTSVL